MAAPSVSPYREKREKGEVIIADQMRGVAVMKSDNTRADRGPASRCTKLHRKAQAGGEVPTAREAFYCPIDVGSMVAGYLKNDSEWKKSPRKPEKHPLASDKIIATLAEDALSLSVCYAGLQAASGRPRQEFVNKNLYLVLGRSMDGRFPVSMP